MPNVIVKKYILFILIVLFIKCMADLLINNTNVPTEEVLNLDSKQPKHLSTLYGPKRLRYPDVIVIGSMKCGTGFLKDVLPRHSEIVGTARTELHYFNNLEHYTWQWYLQQMPKAKGDKLVFEKTPLYVNEKVAAYLISRLSSHPKVILSIRDPVERTISHYLQTSSSLTNIHWTNLENDVTDLDGNIKITSNFIKLSLYAVDLPWWLAHFKLDVNFHIVDADNLIRKPWEELIKIQEFLGIEVQLNENDFVFSEEKGFYCMLPSDRPIGEDTPHEDAELQCLGKDKGHDHSNVISKAFERELYEFFEPYNEKLFKMIGTRFNWTRSY